MTDQRVLVTGGAGYIGAHACKALARAGFTPVAFDNLSTGWAEAVKYGPLVQGDLMDRAAIDAALAEHRPVAVMHFAALSLVGVSMQDPGLYWQDGMLLDENTKQHPINAYGGSKRAIEDMLRDFGASHGLQRVIFRYFNVAGADPEGELGEQHRPETHLIPLMLDAVAGRRPALTVFGSDYPTRDGTCVRDYVHVTDLAAAHVLGLRWLMDGRGDRVFCLGSGTGFTVREVIEASRAVTNREVPIVQGARRAGDAASLVSGSKRAVEELGWQPQHSSLRQMIGDAWAWAQKPGYER